MGPRQSKTLDFSPGRARAQGAGRAAVPNSPQHPLTVWTGGRPFLPGSIFEGSEHTGRPGASPAVDEAPSSAGWLLGLLVSTFFGAKP